jgi:hypothetical protein
VSALADSSGDTRTTTTAVTFAHPFRLGSDTRELPAGTYPVHTDERRFSRGDRSWSVRAEVVVEVRQGGTTAFRHVAPADFDRALAADAATTALRHPSNHPDGA